MHDAYRVNKGGQGTFDQVMQGWEILRRARGGCQYPVHGARRQCRSPAGGVPLLPRRAESQYMQFIPIIERATAETLPLANQGWSERPGGEPPAVYPDGELVTERIGAAGAVRAVSDRHIRRMGAQGCGQGVRAVPSTRRWPTG